MSVANFYIKNPTTAPSTLDGLYFPSSLTSAGIQAAHDEAVAAGGGTVWLGNDTYTVTSTVTIDCSRVSIVGQRAVLNVSSGVKAFTISGTDIQYGTGTQEIRGIRFNSSGGAGSAALYFYTANGVNGSSRINVYNCDINGFERGIHVSQNAYIIQFFGVSIWGCTQCAYSDASTNRGENINWHGCALFNSSYCVYLDGASQDWFFFGCSFDYSGTLVYTSGSNATFTGCHFEMSPPNSGSQAPFYNYQGWQRYHGCDISFGAGTASRNYVWEHGGSFGWYSLADCSFYNIAWATAPASDPSFFFVTNGTRNSGLQITGINNVRITDNFGWQDIGNRTGTVSLDGYYHQIEYMTATGNLTISLTSNWFAGASIELYVKQDATGGRTVTLPAGSVTSGTANTAANRLNLYRGKYTGAIWTWEIIPFA